MQQILDRTYAELIKLGILLLVFIGWGSIFLTHKIAGPLFRFTKTFQSLSQGDLTLRIQLRKWDEAKGLALEFNQMMLALDQKISTVKKLAQNKSSDETLKQIQKELTYFKTSK